MRVGRHRMLEKLHDGQGRDGKFYCERAKDGEVERGKAALSCAARHPCLILVACFRDLL